MFMFGQINDMKLFWNIPLQTEKILPTKIDQNNYVSYNLGEGAFVMNFFSKINFNPKWQKDDSDLFFSKYFFILNKEDIGLFWYKYNRYDGFNYYYDEIKSSFFKRINFTYWLDSFNKYK